MLTSVLLGKLTPLTLAEVRLRLTAPVRLHFLHGGALHGLLCQVLGHELPEGLVPFAPESGRVRFVAGDLYPFGLTLTPPVLGRLAGLRAKLAAVGARKTEPRDGPPVTFGGNFTVEAVETVAEVTAEDVRRLAGEILAHEAGAEAVTLRWLSPLRLERPPALKADGAGYLNGDCFPAGLFLERLGLRLGKLRALFPSEPLVPAVEAWLRAPVRFHGQLLDRRQGLPQGAPLSPLLANLYLDELDEEILGQGYRLVRFADDFVLLCKSVEEAEQARQLFRVPRASILGLVEIGSAEGKHRRFKAVAFRRARKGPPTGSSWPARRGRSGFS